MLAPKAARQRVTGSTPPMRSGNEQLAAGAAVDAVAATAAAAPTAASANVARLTLLDVSTELPPMFDRRCLRRAAPHNVATLTDISLKGKDRDMLAAWT